MPLANGRYPLKQSDWLLDSQPTNPVRRNMPRIGSSLTDVAAALTSGVAIAVAVPLQAGDTVNQVNFKIGATAGATITHWVTGLYDVNGNLLAASADQTSGALATDATIGPALIPVGASAAAPTGITTPGIYYAAIFVTATTVPSLICQVLPRAAVSTGILTNDKILSRTWTSGLTTALPATISTATAVVNVPLVEVN